MRREGRALFASIIFHGLVVGVVIAMTGVLPPPPQKTLLIDVTMVEQPAETSPKIVETLPTSQPQPAALEPPPQPAVKELAPQASPAPRPTPKVQAKTSVKKLQPKEETKIVSQTPAVVLNPAPAPAPTPAPQADVSPAAPAVAEPAPAVTVPVLHSATTNEGEEYRHANFKAIRDAILAKLNYPTLARRRGWSGKVDVAFLIAPDGNVSDLRIETSSGFPVLDDKALEAVRRAAPFTPPHIAALLVMPVAFQLN